MSHKHKHNGAPPELIEKLARRGVVIEAIGRCTFFTIRKHELNVAFHSVGKLVDCLREDGFLEVAEWIEQVLFSSEHLSKSVFIRALFEYMREIDMVALIDRAVSENQDESARKRRKAGGESRRTAQPAARKRPVR